MINQNYLFQIFVTTNKASNNINIYFEILECIIYWTSKKILMVRHISNKLASTWNEENVRTFSSH